MHLLNRLHIKASTLMWFLLILITPPTFHLLLNNTTILLEWTVINIINTPLTFHLIFDQTGILFSCTVLFISANVLSFSTVYIKHDQFIDRFTVLVLLFVSSINILIFIPHFIILLLGWDGLGFTSFVLVIYYQNSRSLGAGIITALSNRIGDAIILIAVACTLHQGHWYIINITQNTNIIFIQITLIILAAITKRAQIPFSRWLPAAIAAPTPVSALVHSSTLVTAGVFLIIRFYPFLHTITFFNTFITLIATSTMLIAGLRALTECDIKKIIALSTLSQLGLMILAIGINMPNLAYFHILTHALFKALLFICAGSLINYHNHTQDLRWIGLTPRQIPIATSCVTIANIALCGLPFISGFYSKDMIIEWAIHSPINYLVILLALISVGVTSAYSVRFRVATLCSPQLCTPHININEELPIIRPIIFLAIIAVTSGRILSWTNPIRNLSTIFIPTELKLLPLLIILLGFFITWKKTTTKINKLEETRCNWQITHWALCTIWFLTPLSTQFSIKFPIWSAHNFIKSIDQGWLEIPQSGHQNLTSYSNILITHSPSSPSTNIIICGWSIILLSIIILISS